MKRGDRVSYRAGTVGQTIVHATVVRQETQFNQRGHVDLVGWWVRPDGWDRDNWVLEERLT